MKHKIITLTLLLPLLLIGCSTSGGDTSSATSVPSQDSSMTSSDSKSNTSSSSKFSSSSKKTYTIEWLNDNGDVLETDRNVEAGTMPTYDGDTPTKAESGGKEYTWSGWAPEVVPVSEDTAYWATFISKQITYNIAYTLNGGTNSVDNPKTYRIGSTFTFKSASKTGYTFEGWFTTSGTEVKDIKEDTTGDLYLNARWKAVKNTLTVTSEDTNKGTVSIEAGEGYSDESIKVVATPLVSYKFDAWYSGTKKISDKATYTFTMPTNDCSLVAKFVYDEEYCQNLGIIPKFSSDKKTVTYGLYPQTNVNDSTLVTALNKLTTPEDNGWYLYNGEYYARLVATPYKNNYKFYNDTTIVAGTTYWFKCEPIKWVVLTSSNDEYYLFSYVILDVFCYYHASTEDDKRILDNYAVCPNDYEDSDIRAWLNGYDGTARGVEDYSSQLNFYNTAFGLGDQYLMTVTVDNSAETTNSPYNTYWCDDTEDKVFLPSYQDFINPNYGFEEDHSTSSYARRCKTTDYARAKGVYYSTSTYPDNGDYWTRSPNRFYQEHYSAWAINYLGMIGWDNVDTASEGVCPAVYLKYSTNN